MTDGTVADGVVAALLEAGVDVVFTLCGNHILPLQEAMRRRGMRCIGTRSEGAAVMAADAYGRVARQAGVALVTGGPGVANTTGALLTALGNQSPVVLLSGEPTTASVGRGAQQEADHVALTTGATKASLRVARADHAIERLREAFALAEHGRTGPVHVTFPVDIQQHPLPEGGVRSARPELTTPAVAPALVRAVADHVRAARRPAVIAGAGVWQHGGEAGTAALAGDHRIPVFTLDSARGIVPDSAACMLGSADPGLNPAASHLALADCVIIAGRDADFRLGYGSLFGYEPVLVHVDPDVRALGRNLPEGAVLCAGDPAAFLADLAVELGDHRVDAEWIDAIAAVAAVAVSPATNGAGQHPGDVADVIARVGVRAGAVFALDCGEFVQWCRQRIPAENAGGWLRLGPQATCGAGLPFGLGAQAARPETPVIVVAGDGGIGYHVAELETALRCGLPITVVVGQDGAWGIERSLQTGVYGDQAAFTSDLTATDFTLVARGFGVEGVRADGPDALESALSEAIAAREPRLVQVAIENRRSTGTDRLIRSLQTEAQQQLA
jgi:acetolactate synthase-1/2/3 large subunit